MAITIQRGDTLSAIAKKYNTTVKALANTNNIRDINRIYAGATLMLPGEVPATDHPLGNTQPQPQPQPQARSLPSGSQILTSPSQISNYNVQGQVGKSGTSGSYLYGTPRELSGSTPSAPVGSTLGSAGAGATGSTSATGSVVDQPAPPADNGTMTYNKVLESIYKASQADYGSYNDKLAAIKKARYEVGTAPLTENQRLLDPGALARSQEQQRSGYSDQISAIESLVSNEKTSNASKISGLKDLLSATKPQEISPGASLYDPVTGKTVFTAPSTSKDKSDELLTPTEAATLNLPYGTTRAQAAAKGVMPKSVLTGQDKIETELKLSKQFTAANKEAKIAERYTSDINIAYKNAESAVKKGTSINAATQGIISAFNKILDPSSVVREAEYARTPQGQSWLAQLSGKFQQIQQGGAGLTLSGLKEFTDLGNQFLESYKDYQTQNINLIRTQADNYGLNIKNIVPADYLDRNYSNPTNNSNSKDGWF